MLDSSPVPEITADDFARRFSMRPGQLMWFLGAGVSASAGIPTASDMIWRFKRDLYVAQRRVSAQTVSDLADPAVQRQLDSHIATLDRLPPPGSPEEYSALFEAAYPAEKDRQTFIASMIAGAKLAYGHLALAAMLKARHSNLVWTTNFDHLLADASAKTFGTTRDLTVVGLETTGLAGQQIASQSWPIEVKIHGDFRSQHLKNTAAELRHQDAQLGAQLADNCGRFGMIVAGYSGRDQSVMSVFEGALAAVSPFPNGFFWLHRGADPPLPQVAELIARAADAGVEAAMVRIDSFDEIMSDLVRQIGTLDTAELDTLGATRSRVSAARAPAGTPGWPIIRLNAIEVTVRPTHCRKVVCTIGGFRDMREAVEAAGVDLVVSRTSRGVLGFGADDDFRAAFDSFDVVEFDIASLETGRMRYDSHERGLLRTALIRALAAGKGLDVVHQRSQDLVAPAHASDPAWQKLSEVAGRIEGTIPGHPEIRWREGAALRLEWADERLWLLVDPRVVFDGVTDENKAFAADFARERTAQRYNQKLDKLVAFWTKRLAGADLRAFGIGNGIDAVFTLDRDTAFSRTMQA